MKLYKKIIILLICLLPLFQTVDAQKETKRKQRKIEKLKEKKNNAALKDYQKSIKQHLNDQSKGTRKMMKQSLRESQRLASGHKEFFLKRWFTKKKNNKLSG